MSRPRRRRPVLAWVYLAFHIICVLVPIAVIIVWSFTSAWPWPDLAPQQFSDRGWAEIFSPARRMPELMATSIVIAVACALFTTLVATLAAKALVEHRFKGRGIFQFATVLPFLVPTVVFAMGVQVAFIKIGLARTDVGVVLAHSIVALPYAVMIMTNVVEAAGTHLSEQAATLGAGLWHRVVHVDIPLLLPGLVSAATMSYILSFSQYILTLLIGGGAVKTLMLVMFPYLTSADRTVASAYGVMFLIATLAVFAVFQLLLRAVRPKDIAYFND